MLYREADMFIICQPEIDVLTKKYKINTHILRYFAVILSSQMATILIFLNIQIKSDSLVRI